MPLLVFCIHWLRNPILDQLIYLPFTVEIPLVFTKSMVFLWIAKLSSG